MRILVVGAGAIGGYFGGRLLEAKQDVTFLVRPRRAAEMAKSGLEIQSNFGDVTFSKPATIQAENLHSPFDLVLLSCKAYDLEGAITALAPAVGPDTAILPLLNGMRHLDILDQRFGAERVLGGMCVISTVLEAGRVLHLNNLHLLTFGERDGSNSARVEAIASAFSGGRFESRLSNAILQEMWEKWVFIATCAGITCLMRASVGDIVSAGAADLVTTLLAECAAIAASQGFPPSPASIQQSGTMMTTPGSGLTASMFRDIERRAPIEASHMIGDLLRRGDERKIASPLLRVAYAHLKAYEARRARESATSGSGD
jgi:2-dehydropantoate 2-reductase